MSRLLLACLLMLSACAPKEAPDPEGTLVLGKNPAYTASDSIVIAAGTQGDSRYFRLPGGTIRFTLMSQKDITALELSECRSLVELRDLKGEKVKELYNKGSAPLFTPVNVNLTNGGVYYLYFDADYSFCIPVVMIEKA